jgi:NADH-quinone oxidoreductase subunit C
MGDDATPKPPPPKPAPAEQKIEAPPGPPDPPPPDGTTHPVTVTAVADALPGAVTQVSYWVGDWTIVTTPDRLVEVCRFLRDDPRIRLDFCSDMTASDWPPRAARFDVVYCLYSTAHRHRLRVKIRVGDGEAVPSVTEVWPSADWLEREVYDMFGVNIVNHPDRRRILMPDDWQGHPQRKDYPLEGPGELVLEDPVEWLRLRNAASAADID